MYLSADKEKVCKISSNDEYDRDEDKDERTMLARGVASKRAQAGIGGAAKDSTDSQNRVGSWSCEGHMPDTSWEATECRGVNRSKNLKKQSKG